MPDSDRINVIRPKQALNDPLISENIKDLKRKNPIN